MARSAPEPSGDRRLREIPLDEIHPNPDQPRRHFDPDALDALAGSIRERGVLQPVIVRPRAGGGYQLIAGERRWRAAALADLTVIPALIDEAVDGAVSLELALIENIARADLTVIEPGGIALDASFGRVDDAMANEVGRFRVSRLGC